jgi:ring-1,2-phenylacetyl-CoA epoxidase subunit PaaE
MNHVVTIMLYGEEFKITVEPGRSILETALDANINMPFSCQSGLCTACRGKLKTGKVQMDNPDGLSDDEIAQGYVLTCVSHPLTENVVIEMG